MNKLRLARLMVLLCASSAISLVQAQTVEQLVEQTLLDALADVYETGSYTVTALPVSAAVKQKPCVALTAQVRSKQLYGRVPVHVRCSAPTPWSLYATAQVEVQTPVIVVQRGIARGERITAEAIALEQRPINQLRSQTISAAKDALGKVARRSLSAGQVLTLNQLSVPMAVEKGERVHIVAHSGRVQIQAYGTALASGAIGDQIRVQNDMSERIIQPWIVAPGRVSTVPPRH